MGSNQFSELLTTSFVTLFGQTFFEHAFDKLYYFFLFDTFESRGMGEKQIHFRYNENLTVKALLYTDSLTLKPFDKDLN